jgi:hypothetical protein
MTTLKAMPFSEEDMITASELRDFIYCARSWSLARHGFTVAREVQAQRDAGIRFHEERAEHALQGSRPSPLIAGYLLVAAGILLLLVFLVRGGH